MIKRSHNSILVRQKCLTNKLRNGQKIRNSSTEILAQSEYFHSEVRGQK